MKLLKYFSVLFLLAARLLVAQVDLVEMQKKEEERRKKMPPSKSVVTEENIKEIFKEKKGAFAIAQREESAGTVESAQSEESAQVREEVPTDPEATPQYWQDELKRIKDKIHAK